MNTERHTNTPKCIADVDAQLNDWARARGFRSHVDMANKLETRRSKLARAELRSGLDDLKPIADQAAMAAANANVDGTGLPQIQDLQKCIARLVRVLLLGYTGEELKFLNERALGIQSFAIASENTKNAGSRLTDLAEHAVDDPPSREPIVAVRRTHP